MLFIVEIFPQFMMSVWIHRMTSAKRWTAFTVLYITPAPIFSGSWIPQVLNRLHWTSLMVSMQEDGGRRNSPVAGFSPGHATLKAGRTGTLPPFSTCSRPSWNTENGTLSPPLLSNCRARKIITSPTPPRPEQQSLSLGYLGHSLIQPGTFFSEVFVQRLTHWDL